MSNSSPHTDPLPPHDALEGVLDGALASLRQDTAASDLNWAPDDGGRRAVRAAFQRVLLHHRAEFARAHKPARTEDVVASLSRGEFAVGRPREDVNLWDDVALATLIGRHSPAATECFRRRFAARVGGWQNRYSRGVKYECDEFLADLLLPRERSGPRIESYAGNGPLDGWLQQVYMSLCHKRREQGQAHGEGRGGLTSPAVRGGVGSANDDGPADPLGSAAATGDAPDDRFARLECADRLAPLIRASLDVLDANSRTVLMMAVVDDVPQKNIAELYGLKEYKVTRLKQAAIRKVADAFRALAERSTRLTAESVGECLELLMERFPAT